MALRFDSEIADDGVRVSLFETRALRGKKPIAFAQWAHSLDKTAWRQIKALVEQERASPQGDTLFLPHKTVASLSQVLCKRFSLPDLAQTSIALKFDGRIDSPAGRLILEWQDENYRAIRPERRGTIIDIGGKAWRLSPLFFELCESADAFNATRGQSVEQRIAAWGPVRDALDLRVGRGIKPDEYAESLYFFQAGAFTLDIVESRDGPDFKPILMRRVESPLTDDEAPAKDCQDESETEQDAEKEEGAGVAATGALPSAKQEAFLKSFEERGSTRDAYVLGNNSYVIVSPDLKIALDVVREKRRASLEERREFLRNPRSAIADALEAHRRDVSPLFIETKVYSDRVEGLGYWKDISLAPAAHNGGWLPEGFPAPVPASLITQENIEEIERAVASAEAAGADHVEVEGKTVPLVEAKSAIERVRNDGGRPAPASTVSEETSEDREDDGKFGLVIKTNIDGVEYATKLRPRKAHVSSEFPSAQMSSNEPKEHQRHGFKWLVEAWCAGWSGVLLADDMGLGKTYQALAFLAWVRENQKSLGSEGARSLHRTSAAFGPILIVAPTSLLKNWQEEAVRHLAQPGLGECIEAFGTKLRFLKRRGRPPEDALDIDALRGAHWILTTYETLADYHRAFARVPYSVAVFDEMQKIKDPNSINTRSAGTLNIDFALGLTGTPIENRIEDLWCLFDRLAPGYLGALRDFSQRYSGDNRERLAELKSRIDTPNGNCPAPLLRRMKDRARDGLPEKHVKPYRELMPAAQAEAYERIVATAASADGLRAQMLKVLHDMRGVSLHPDGARDVNSQDKISALSWIEGSARLRKAYQILQALRGHGEKALVFVEYIGVQNAFAEAVAALFDLDRIPDVINGGVPGERRQDIVKRFQERGPGFDMLMLSPKAAGVGLTITAATHVIHLSRWWNPAVEDQCNDRAYRIGQTRDVTIHVPMAIHPHFGDQSFDVKLDQLLNRKRDLSRDMLIPPEMDEDLSTLFESVTAAA